VEGDGVRVLVVGVHDREWMVVWRFVRVRERAVID
jgi:hypothetical protein